jgi:large subunit ribosomal protein L17
MKKRHSKRILGRKIGPRKALMRSLIEALLTHGSIETTEAKAKEIRVYCEPLITKAKQGEALAVRRALLAATGGKKVSVQRLFELGKANSKRPGGYLRLTRLPVRRGDNSVMMRVDIIDKG